MKRKSHKFADLVDVIEKELLALRPHSPVPSLNEMTERFGVSQTSAKRAMLELQHRGLIYSRVGSGSFVSPPSKRHTILVVFDLERSIGKRDMFNQEFLVSALVHCNRNYPSYTVMAIDFAEFKNNISSIDACYPSLKGVIVLRYISEYCDIVKSLKKLGISCCFYGSSAYSGELKSMDCLIYNESEIISIALEALLERGCVRIGFIKIPQPGFAVVIERQQILARLLKQRRINFSYIAQDATEFRTNSIACLGHDRKTRDAMRLFLSKIDGLICFSDSEAVLFLRSALELGFKIPDELAIVGINNSTFYNQPSHGITTVELNTVADAQRCIDLLMERILSGKHFRKETSIRLIRRETA